MYELLPLSRGRIWIRCHWGQGERGLCVQGLAAGAGALTSARCPARHPRRRRRCRCCRRSGWASVWAPRSLRRALFSSSCRRASWKAGICLPFSCLRTTRQSGAGLRDAAGERTPRQRVQRRNEVKERGSSPEQPGARHGNAGLQLAGDASRWHGKGRSIQTSALGFEDVHGGASAAKHLDEQKGFFCKARAQRCSVFRFYTTVLTILPKHKHCFGHPTLEGAGSCALNWKQLNTNSCVLVMWPHN